MVEHFAAVKARRAQYEHVGPLKDRGSPRSNFDIMLLAFLGMKPRTGATGLRDGRRAAMLAALDGKATWPQIRRWRRGNAQAPMWALEKLDQKMTARQNELARGQSFKRRSA